MTPCIPSFKFDFSARRMRVLGFKLLPLSAITLQGEVVMAPKPIAFLRSTPMCCFYHVCLSSRRQTLYQLSYSDDTTCYAGSENYKIIFQVIFLLPAIKFLPVDILNDYQIPSKLGRSRLLSLSLKARFLDHCSRDFSQSLQAIIRIYLNVTRAYLRIKYSKNVIIQFSLIYAIHLVKCYE